MRIRRSNNELPGKSESEVYNMMDFSLKDLHNQKASEWIEKLNNMVKKTGIRRFKDNYWAPTPGNAGHALNILLTWAKQHPDAVFEVA